MSAASDGDLRARMERLKARMRAHLAATPRDERGPSFAEGLLEDIEYLRHHRARATALLLDNDSVYDCD